MKKLQIVYRDPRELKPNPRNSRKHSPQQIAEIAKSITEFGFNKPIMIDEEDMIIYGHGTVLASKELNLDSIPTVDGSHMSDRQKRAFMIADNKIGHNSSWDIEMLSAELSELAELEFDVGMIGFDEQELDGLLKADPSILPDDFGMREENGMPDPQPEPEDDDFQAPAEDDIETEFKPGDLIQIGKHRLLCGDSTDRADVEKLLGEAKPYLMITDPPYGVEYDPSWRMDAGINKNEGKMGKVENDDQADWSDAWQLSPAAVAYVFHAGKHSAVVQCSLEKNEFEIRSQIIWVKERFALSRGHYHWRHEPCWYAVKKGETAKWIGDRSQSTVWEINSRDDSGSGHGTQKPLKCMARPMKNHNGDVYDPFLGSGTTMVAAHEMERVCYGMELNRKYCQIIVNPMLALEPSLVVTVNGQAYGG